MGVTLSELISMYMLNILNPVWYNTFIRQLYCAQLKRLYISVIIACSSYNNHVLRSCIKKYNYSFLPRTCTFYLICLYSFSSALL